MMDKIIGPVLHIELDKRRRDRDERTIEHSNKPVFLAQVLDEEIAGHSKSKQVVENFLPGRLFGFDKVTIALADDSDHGHQTSFRIGKRCDRLTAIVERLNIVCYQSVKERNSLAAAHLDQSPRLTVIRRPAGVHVLVVKPVG